MRAALLSLGRITKLPIRVLVIALTWTAAALGVPSLAAAQETRCSYQECGLRIERQRLLQGARGEQVGQLGVFYDNVRVLETGADSVAWYAVEYKRNNRHGNLLTLTGLAFGLAGVFLTQNRDNGSSWTATSLMWTGVALDIVGSHQLIRAQTALSRSVWWHNAPQQPAMARDSGCTYQECALRIERGQLLQGTRGERIGRTGVFTNDLRILELGPDSAAHYARKYRSDNRSGILLFVASLGLATAGFVVGTTDIVNSDIDDDRAVAALGLMGASLGTSFWGSRRMIYAQVALSRSVWWYNAGMIGVERRDPELAGLSPLGPAHYAAGGAAPGSLQMNVEFKVRLPADSR